MKVFTIGYGGRSRDEFLALLKGHGVRAVVDIRLRPDRASMGIWIKAKSPDKGVENSLRKAGIEYRSLVELGNLFLGFDDWQERYGRFLDRVGDLLVERLADVPQPFCLMCAEKHVADCHRRHVAEFLARMRGAEVVHIE